METMKRGWKTVAVAAFLLLLGVAELTSGVAQAKSDGDVELLSSGVDEDARGTMRFRARGSSDARLEVRVSRLEGAATYELVADGVKVAEIATTSQGTGRIRLRSRMRPSRDDSSRRPNERRGSRREGFLGFDPRGMVLVVRDVAGQDVLSGLVPSAGSSSGGDIVCCIPDDSGPECEDRTPEECVAQGGTVSEATSCLPNPCAGTTPTAGRDVICCIPDDSGPECEDRTVDECAVQGGIVVEGNSCLPNPCTATTPGDPDIRCCLPDDSGTECEDRTPEECVAQGGIDIGPGMCTLNACADVVLPPGSGNASARVRCERRSSRSKVSVDGTGLTAGAYQARVVSAANVAISAFQSAIGDEAEFDFDSDGGDIAEGATPISSSFLQGSPPQVLGQILDGSGIIVVESLVTCDVR
jgi:hypothetical protein